MRLGVLHLAGSAIALCALHSATDAARAHHSHAMFDFESHVEMTGTVREFKWTNPHSWLHLEAVGAQGEPVVYAIEMGAPAGLAYQGWSPSTVAPGDRVLVSIHPLLDGRPGGELRYITLSDGTSLGEGHEDAEFQTESLRNNDP